MNLQRLEPGARLSQAVVGGDLVWLAGQVAANPTGDVADQTRQVLAAIDRLLALAGSDRRHIASVTIYLSDMDDFARMNAVWDAWVPADAKPARATVEARLATPEFRVEMQVIAVRA